MAKSLSTWFWRKIAQICKRGRPVPKTHYSVLHKPETKEKLMCRPSHKVWFQPRIGKMRAMCSKGTFSPVFFLSSGWLNSFCGKMILPSSFSTIHPLLLTWCSMNLSRDAPSMLTACAKCSWLMSKGSYQQAKVNRIDCNRKSYKSERFHIQSSMIW